MLNEHMSWNTATEPAKCTIMPMMVNPHINSAIDHLIYTIPILAMSAFTKSALRGTVKRHSQPPGTIISIMKLIAFIFFTGQLWILLTKVGNNISLCFVPHTELGSVYCIALLCCGFSNLRSLLDHGWRHNDFDVQRTPRSFRGVGCHTSRELCLYPVLRS